MDDSEGSLMEESQQTDLGAMPFPGPEDATLEMPTELGDAQHQPQPEAMERDDPPEDAQGRSGIFGVRSWPELEDPDATLPMRPADAGHAVDPEMPSDAGHAAGAEIVDPSQEEAAGPEAETDAVAQPEAGGAANSAAAELQAEAAEPEAETDAVAQPEAGGAANSAAAELGAGMEGYLPGAAQKGIPIWPDHNNFHYVDHIFVTCDHIQDVHTREGLGDSSKICLRR